MTKIKWVEGTATYTGHKTRARDSDQYVTARCYRMDPPYVGHDHVLLVRREFYEDGWIELSLIPASSTGESLAGNRELMDFPHDISDADLMDIARRKTFDEDGNEVALTPVFDKDGNEVPLHPVGGKWEW